MKKINYVLWTGGWDSTFRVIQLYRLGANIQPIYIHDQCRKSSKKELELIHNLSIEIPSRFKQSKGKILPIIIINRKEIPYNLFLKLIIKVLKIKINLGKQYYWLATVAKKYKNLELSAHKEDRDRLFYEDQLIEIKDEQIGLNWRINPKKLDFFRRHLFKNMTFPLITISKPEMKNIAEENNFIDLMEKTWFCHKSNIKPCGKCVPCKQYIRDGFGYRLENYE
ncbi:adenine nucleotide alpha hydrolase family protein [Formosa maritima]|uniref:7-cyano-7-deazaguanine synthase n=1 Tax=Formosa maritima TaxID=2592046 RepID=A0A5D0G4U2_9FLAO|nr:7-cyano-7-deazaguanine synthase [Formosa maritima]TYA53878.1 hypothetical protein FVF61_09710 [Formosa maritima]